ncbi:PD-(D/E)XK nuclease family protein [Sporocytophaga myxococcoides]|uniref:PD-(D/E)XK nuclease family protein n=1 Tax=Sporocytophaga myxococcoides TaxID=153721 RepID=UPI00040308C1|nr:PD-(D/E)XK nuclease family protein [Sporocytophaga myxococcoides]
MSDLEINLLETVSQLLQEQINAISKVVSDNKLQTLTRDYDSHKIRIIYPGFNPFILVSDKYQRENFHSDILHSILDPEGAHKEGYKFLEAFIKYLSGFEKGRKITVSDYRNSKVDKEIGRIDISIKDNLSKKAIIIENKINNAPDQARQIPRYYDSLVSQGYEVEAVVYLSLNNNKQPDTGDWTEEDRKVIGPKMIIVNTYDETTNDLFNGWLTRCERLAQNVDVLFLLRQYNNLIAFIGGVNMNKPLMDEFLKVMLIGDNYKTASSLSAMLTDLISYRREKVLDSCRKNCRPFTKVYGWSINYAVLDNFFKDNMHFAIDIISESDLYRFQFIERKYLNSDKKGDDPILPFLESSGFIKEFKQNGDRREKLFDFPSQEDEFYNFIPEFLNKVSHYYMV